MSREMLPDSFDFNTEGASEFRRQMLRIKDTLESLVLEIAAAAADRRIDEDADLAYRRHVQRAVSLLIRDVPSSASQHRECQVFLSYKSDDKPFAEEVRKKLSAKKLRVFLASTSIDAGSDWEDSIFEALRLCQVAVFLITPNSVASEWCNDSFLAVLESDQ